MSLIRYVHVHRISFLPQTLLVNQGLQHLKTQSPECKDNHLKCPQTSSWSQSAGFIKRVCNTVKSMGVHVYGSGLWLALQLGDLQALTALVG